MMEYQLVVPPGTIKFHGNDQAYEEEIRVAFTTQEPFPYFVKVRDDNEFNGMIATHDRILFSDYHEEQLHVGRKVHNHRAAMSQNLTGG